MYSPSLRSSGDLGGTDSDAEQDERAAEAPSAGPGRGVVLRYTADRFAVFWVLFVFSLQVGVLLYATPALAAGAAVVITLLAILSAPMNHNHQHVNVFRRPLLNRLYELPLALQTGVGPFTWVLHHNLGHHLNYLQQPPGDGADESHWTRADGSQMGRLEYSIRLFFRHPFDVYRVGRKHPRTYRRYLLTRIPLYCLGLGLFWLSPVNYLIVFVAAPALTLFHTCWVTYEHHAGLHTDDHSQASYNRINRVYNILSSNLGYHTAHHMRPGVHWSQLPALHERIRGEIPAPLITTKFW